MAVARETVRVGNWVIRASADENLNSAVFWIGHVNGGGKEVPAGSVGSLYSAAQRFQQQNFVGVPEDILEWVGSGAAQSLSDRLVSQAKGSPTQPEDNQPVGEETPATEAQNQGQLTEEEIQNADNSVETDTGGSVLSEEDQQEADNPIGRLEQTDPGENPWTTAGQTDPGESPVTATDGGNINYNDPKTSPKKTADEVPQVPVENPLHNFASYTYSLRLYAMGFKDYESLVDNPKLFGVPSSNLLAASAGRGAKERNGHFNTEFYFDSLTFDTVIGITPQTTNSNMVQGVIKIVEPLGFTFINRLSALAGDLGVARVQDIPFLLVIDFFGYDDSGSVKPNPIEFDAPGGGKTTTSKNLPIKFVSVATEVTERGSEYNIDFIPYNHIGTMDEIMLTYDNFNIRGSTVKELLGETETAISPDEEQPKSGIDGLAGAMNRYFLSVKRDNKSDPNLPSRSIRFEIDQEIANSKFFPEGAGSTFTTAPASETDRQKQLNLASPVIQDKKEIVTIPVKKGQRIDKMIDYIIRNSDYIRKQLPEGAAVSQDAETITGDPLRWYKIYPRIKPIGFDTVQNKHIYDITYVIKPYRVATKHKLVNKPKVQGNVKEYKYIFTGQNTDIIDFKLNFNMLYFNTIPLSVTNNTQLQNIAVQNKNPDSEQIKKIAKTGELIPSTVPLNTNWGKSDRSGAQNNKSSEAAHIFLDLVTASQGDLVNVDLNIVGDPLFIKQDDIVFLEKLEPNSDFLTPNGSFIMDRGELYVNLVFVTPKDYDETTGLTKLKK
jgi:hypothetical protein